MIISEERLNEFKTTYEQHYNKKLNDSEASELAEKFIDLMKHLLLSNSVEEGKQ